MILALLAPALPLALAPSAPFPALTAQAVVAPAFVAPGIVRADYVLRTADGPLTVHVVGLDPREASVRIGTVLAHDRLVSAGETVSSMAHRTGAVAGINADYFDIGATNQPLGVVVRDGVLLRSPSRRAALWVDRRKSVSMGQLAFAGTVRWDGSSVPLTGVDVWPPQDGASLILPAYGATVAGDQVVTVPLQPVDAAQGMYRAAPGAGAGAPLLALGPSALALAAPPAAGTTVAVDAALVPPLAGIASAVGGGPLLVRDGQPFNDPDTPAPELAARRFPLSGAALRGDGSLLLIAVDGRRAETSIGLTRAQFAALLRAFGARDGMTFDSGGSTTLVARVLGDAQASVRNDPSDGAERPVADGLFVYSDAAPGPPDRLALRPQTVRALPGSRVAVEARIVDAAGHAYGSAAAAGSGPPGMLRDGMLSVPADARTGLLAVRAGTLRGELAVDVVERLAQLRVTPLHANPDPGAVLALAAAGEDARGDAVATTGAVHWSAENAAIGADGTLHAGTRDAVVSAQAGGIVTRVTIPVGRHDVAFAAFDAPQSWTFASAPKGAPGAVGLDGGVLTLAYDFTGATRAAYALTTTALPGEPVAIAVDVQGDGSGVALRAQFLNRYGETVALTLAPRIDWQGWRTLRVRLPGDLNPPVALKALYVLPRLGSGVPVRGAGQIALRALVLSQPGSP